MDTESQGIRNLICTKAYDFDIIFNSFQFKRFVYGCDAGLLDCLLFLDNFKVEIPIQKQNPE